MSLLRVFRLRVWLLPLWLLLIGVAFLPSAAAQTLVYEGTLRNQTVQESAKARLKVTFSGNKVTGYLTTYPPLQGSAPVTGVRKGNKCVLSAVIDEDAVMELRGACREAGFDGGYVVSFEGNYRPQRGSFLLQRVVDAPRTVTIPDGSLRHSTNSAPDNSPPVGDYGVYQHTGTLGYDFLYRLRLLNEREYLAFNNTIGAYVYDAKTRQFTFQSGPLVDYTGAYFTQEKGGVARAKIVLRQKALPASGDAASLLREYLYAFYRPEGIQ